MAATAYDEMHAPDGTHRPHYRSYCTWLQGQASDRLARRRAEADSLFHRVGITFAVYGEGGDPDAAIAELKLALQYDK